MPIKCNYFWFMLLAAAGVFSALFLWWTLFPGRVPMEVWQYFTAEQVQQGRAYSRFSRLIFLAGFLLQLVFLLWLLVSGKAMLLSRWAQQLTGATIWSYLVFFVVLWLALLLLKLPLDLLHGYYWQHHWGFATQTMWAWWLDFFKGAGMELVLSAIGVLILFGAAGRWPGQWWLVIACLLSLWLLVQTLLWPVLISPLFNRFEPARDPAVVKMVEELSAKAGLEVEQVLVMDASRRTTKANAYFTGLGPSKRIVLYDNLLRDYPLDEVEAVVAHEMAHYKLGHIKQGLALGIVANFALWGVLFFMLRTALGSGGLYQPFSWALIVLFLLLMGFAASPVTNTISRSMEKEADALSVVWTENVDAAKRLEIRLAVKNKADLAPPAFISWFSSSHPPVLERIGVIDEAGERLK